MVDGPRTMAQQGPVRTVVVAFAVSLVCSVLVSGAAIALRPQYQANQELNRQQNVLAAAGLLVPGGDVATLFEQVEARVVDLETGAYIDQIDPESLDPRRVARESSALVEVPREVDVALIRSRAKYVVVYLVYEAERPALIILPVYGYGLWSTMYGYLALEADANTIAGLRFYDHGETPGLGGEIDNQRWLGLWPGKRVYGPSAEPQIEVVRPAARDESRAGHQVDGISGATLTGNGVTNLLRYWLGEHGFGPYLSRIRNSQRNANET